MICWKSVKRRVWRLKPAATPANSSSPKCVSWSVSCVEELRSSRWRQERSTFCSLQLIGRPTKHKEKSECKLNRRVDEEYKKAKLLERYEKQEEALQAELKEMKESIAAISRKKRRSLSPVHFNFDPKNGGDDDDEDDTLWQNNLNNNQRGNTSPQFID